MSPPSVLLLVLQLCSLHLMLVAMPTCHLQGNVVQTAHNLLRDLGAPFPVHCLQYNINVSFPGSAFPAATVDHPQCRRALGVVYESLRGVGLMFEDHDLPEREGGVTWDATKLDNFRNLQDRLLDKGSCLSDVDASAVLSSYFSNVTAVVQQCGVWLARYEERSALGAKVRSAESPSVFHLETHPLRSGGTLTD
ncbi:hypothetical protein PAMA_010010 [Pampus argenteus]